MLLAQALDKSNRKTRDGSDIDNGNSIHQSFYSEYYNNTSRDQRAKIGNKHSDIRNTHWPKPHSRPDHPNISLTKQHHQSKPEDEVKILNTFMSDFQVNDNSGINGADQKYPSISTDGNGNFVITWADERNGNSDIYAQRYTSDGLALGTNFKINDDQGGMSQREPSICTDGSGNFLVTWQDWRNGDLDIYAQRYTSDGLALGTNFKVNDDQGDAWQTSPSVSTHSSGNFVITWVDERQQLFNSDIYAQRYSSGGNPLGANFKVNDDQGFKVHRGSPSISTDSSGNFVITWYDRRIGNYEIYAQRYTSDGSASGTNFIVNDDQESAAQWDPSISTDGSGNFVITWRDYRNGGSDIYVQRYTRDGNTLGTNFKVNDDQGSAGQLIPSISTDSSGNFVITWADERNGNSDIYAQRYSSVGSTIGKNFRVTNTSEKSQRDPDVKLWNGRIYNTWTDNRAGGTGHDIWANVLNWENPIGTGIVNVPADTNSIQGGIYLANEGDTVLVAPGIYSQTHRILFPGFQDSVNTCVTMKPGIVLMSESGPENTIIKNDTAKVVISVQYIPDTTTVISGFTIEFNEYWGILCNPQSSALIENNIIKKRFKIDGFGGIGIVFSDSSNGVFRNNEIETDTTEGGFGILTERGSSPRIQGNIFNSLEGGISNENDYSSPVIINNQFVNNYRGFDSNGTNNPKLSENIFTNNRYAVWLNDSETILKGNIFSGSRTSIVTSNADLTLLNNIFFQDTTGIDAYGGSINLMNNTMYGISNGIIAQYSDCYLNIYNTILWNYDLPIDTLFSPIVDIRYSDLQGNWSGEGNISSDPLFVNV
jgi:parallel beta-helix repeat protein